MPGRVVEAEALWYDRNRWAAWVDGFGHVARIEGDWPAVGSRLLWDSPPRGRGRVAERMTAYDPRSGSTVEVEDEKMYAVQRVTFEPDGLEQVRVTLALEWELKDEPRFSGLIRPLFVGRAMRDSLRRTLARFAHERRAEREP